MTGSVRFRLSVLNIVSVMMVGRAVVNLSVGFTNGVAYGSVISIVSMLAKKSVWLFLLFVSLELRPT